MDKKDKLIIGDAFLDKTDMGHTREILIKKLHIEKEWLKIKKLKTKTRLDDFQGIYIIYDENIPFYVGRSNDVIRRIYQHVNGKTDTSATLAFKFGQKLFKIENPNLKLKNRRELDFEKYCKPFQKEMRKFKIVFDQIQNDVELYLFELYASVELKTNQNRFKCH